MNKNENKWTYNLPTIHNRLNISKYIRGDNYRIPVKIGIYLHIINLDESLT